VPVLLLLLLAAEAILVIRLVAVRATLPLTALPPYVVYGFLAGPFAVTAIRRLMAPYGWNGTEGWHGVVNPLVVGCGTLLVLSLPVLAAMHSRVTRSGLSVADAFLLAWTCGFGFDLHQQLVTAVFSSERLHGYLFLPPDLFQMNETTSDACAYLLALPILGYAAASRFLRNALVGRIVLVALTVFCGLAYGVTESGGAEPFGHLFMLNSSLFYWCVLLILIALQFVEARLAGRRIAPGAVSSAAEWRGAVTALLAAHFSEFREALGRFQMAVRAELGQFDSTLRKPPSFATARAAGAFSLRPWWLQAAMILLAVVLFVSPRYPSLLTDFFGIPLIHAGVSDSGQLTLLILALVVLIFWRYATAAGSPPAADVDDFVRFAGDRAVLRAALGIAMVALLYGQVGEFYGRANRLAQMEGVGIGDLDPRALATLALAIAAAATGVQLRRRLGWAAAMPARRRVAVERILEIAILVVGGWLALSVFSPLQRFVHASYGATLFGRFGGNGNSAGDLLLALLLMPVIYGLFRGFRYLAARFTAFLFDETGRTPPDSPVRSAMRAGSGS